MKLLRKLGTKPNKNGFLISYGEFLCEYDNKIVIRSLSNGLKQVSCGCIQGQLLSLANTGKKRTEEQNKKNSELAKERLKNPENHPMYGKKQTQETRQKIKTSLTGRTGKQSPLFGKKKSEEHNRKNSESHKGKQLGDKNFFFGKKFIRELNGNWQGGISFLPYAPEFNKPLKQSILERDNYICQCPDCKQKSDKLAVHHIDYDKQNNNPENLITLCPSCHSKTNGKNKRKYFTEYYQNIMMGKLMECFL